jgi:hypothetical protein
MSVSANIDNINLRIEASNFQTKFQSYIPPSINERCGEIVFKFLEDSTLINWNKMATAIEEFISVQSQVMYPNGRVLVSMPDGRVAYASGSDRNSYENFLKGDIEENHNTRVAIITALLDESGRGFEIKRSSLAGGKQVYQALRMGSRKDDPIGVVRVSYDLITA